MFIIIIVFDRSHNRLVEMLKSLKRNDHVGE